MEGWYVRVGILATQPLVTAGASFVPQLTDPSSSSSHASKKKKKKAPAIQKIQTHANAYGARRSLPLMGLPDLARYSLIIPAFTRRADIPSGKLQQRGLDWLWGNYEHVRYFGVLDLDMATEAIHKGDAPLWTDRPRAATKDKGQVKKNFAARLVHEQLSYADAVRLCPSFAKLYRAVCALQACLVNAKVPCVVYFSGGGGFRVLFYSPLAWRRVHWGQGYAAAFHENELRTLLQRLAGPDLSADTLDIVMAATDKNIYDSDKGTKPDLRAHFDTGIFPEPLLADQPSAFFARIVNTRHADPSLNEGIRGFWRHVFSQLSVEAEGAASLVAPLTEPACIFLRHHALLRYHVVKKMTEATHFLQVGDKWSYRHVPECQTEELYQRLSAQWAKQLPISAHEMRTTPLTRMALDYDGGPPLLEPVGGTTPLAVICRVLHEQVLGPTATPQEGLVVMCPPRPGTTGMRAHLHWPQWIVRLTPDQADIVRVLQRGLLAALGPAVWKDKFLESPPRLRMVFSDTLHKETGRMANRPLIFAYRFDRTGQPLPLSDADRQGTRVDLMRLCSLRVTLTEQQQQSPLPLQETILQPRMPKSASPTNGNTEIEDMVRYADMTLSQRAACEKVALKALRRVRQIHQKPDACLYNLERLTVNNRVLRIGLRNHHQCTDEHAHGGNNVRLELDLDADWWHLCCFREDCPRRYRVDAPWNKGQVKTRALRRAFPSSRIHVVEAGEEHLFAPVSVLPSPQKK